MSGPPPDRTVEVCREFTRQRCQRSETECRYAHPPPHVETINGRVTCCVDSIKGRCQREKCRYYHPPPQIGEHVLRGAPPPRGDRGGGGPGPGPRYNEMGMGDVGVNPYLATALRGYKSALDAALNAASWLAQPGGGGGGPYDGPGGPGGPGGLGGRPERSARTDGIEVCKEFLRGRCTRQENDCRFAHPPDNITIGVDNTVTACIDFIKGRCQRDPCRYFHPPDHLAARFRPGGVGASAGRKRPFSSSRADENGSGYKRPAYDDM